jgi:hypothetical protein
MEGLLVRALSKKLPPHGSLIMGIDLGLRYSLGAACIDRATANVLSTVVSNVSSKPESRHRDWLLKKIESKKQTDQQVKNSMTMIEKVGLKRDNNPSLPFLTTRTPC